MTNIFRKDRNISKLRVKEEFLKRVEYKCLGCGNGGVYNEKPLVLQLDHIDGDRYNHHLSNLRLLCPNCHSQQPTSYRSNTKKFGITNEHIAKEISGKRFQSIREIVTHFGISESRQNYQRVKKICDDTGFEFVPLTRNVKRGPDAKRFSPTKEELTKMVWERPIYLIAKDYNVSGKTIANWCEYFNIEKPLRGYWSKKNC